MLLQICTKLDFGLGFWFIFFKDFPAGSKLELNTIKKIKKKYRNYIYLPRYPCGNTSLDPHLVHLSNSDDLLTHLTTAACAAGGITEGVAGGGCTREDTKSKSVG